MGRNISEEERKRRVGGVKWGGSARNYIKRMHCGGHAGRKQIELAVEGYRPDLILTAWNAADGVCVTRGAAQRSTAVVLRHQRD